MIKRAKLSQDRAYRYALWRTWNETLPYALFLGLNPSNADEIEDDPTIRRCISFARDWGFGGLCMANLFAYRTQKPQIMMSVDFPVGDDNDAWLIELSKGAGIIICAWGNDGAHQKRDKKVLELLSDYPLNSLGITKYGYPRHPLYVKGDTKPIPYP